MILQALQYTLFGMLGIFLVMGIIIATITLLEKAVASKEKGKKADQAPNSSTPQ